MADDREAGCAAAPTGRLTGGADRVAVARQSGRIRIQSGEILHDPGWQKVRSGGRCALLRSPCGPVPAMRSLPCVGKSYQRQRLHDPSRGLIQSLRPGVFSGTATTLAGSAMPSRTIGTFLPRGAPPPLRAQQTCRNTNAPAYPAPRLFAFWGSLWVSDVTLCQLRWTS